MANYLHGMWSIVRSLFNRGRRGQIMETAGMTPQVAMERFHSSDQDTLGLMFITGKFACVILEDEYREEKVMHETRIPAGVYELVLVESPKFSPRFGHRMIMLKDVPNFSFIYIHPGVRESHTSGCLLTGDSMDFNPNGPSELRASRQAYDRVYEQITDMMATETVFIEVIDRDRKQAA